MILRMKMLMMVPMPKRDTHRHVHKLMKREHFTTSSNFTIIEHARFDIDRVSASLIDTSRNYLERII